MAEGGGGGGALLTAVASSSLISPIALSSSLTFWLTILRAATKSTSKSLRNNRINGRIKNHFFLLLKISLK
jgi:hypothetical protein